mgnify:CR=1 FL=1
MHLRENIVKNKGKVVWKLTMFAYRKLQEALISKAIEYNVPIVFVNPRGTSSICPRCSTKWVYNHKPVMCPRCGFVADRDRVGAMNI